MKYFIFVFRARSQATRLFQKIKNYARAQLVSTPGYIYPECSLSVKTDESALRLAFSLISGERLNTFIGAYYVNETENTVQRINPNG